jgi:hypothetical protein
LIKGYFVGAPFMGALFCMSGMVADWQDASFCMRRVGRKH